MSEKDSISLSDRGVTPLEGWRDRHLEYKLRPNDWWPVLLLSCEVRILMVTDAGGSFGTSSFGLKALIDALAEPPGPWVHFKITTANRRTDPTAELQNFTFDGVDLADFDQIWMFGVERSGWPSLSEQELGAVSRFMDDGGGVFATGDHEDLGVAMCGDVPRVRSMRKWHWPDPGPNGEPVAPEVDGENRLDTLREGSSSGFQFDDQSDDIPQRISPRMYPSWTFPWPALWRAHPHPVLCGPRGVIRVLPDHPHEGECYVPTDLSASFTYDGYTIEEYPETATGDRLAPEIAATSTIVGGRSTADVKGEVTPRRFGAIGTWDGHRVSRGRVLVDATWHHFFNINLVGDPESPDPLKRIGFAASPAGTEAYEEIKAYFRNIAVWLARPERHTCMKKRALWFARWNPRLVMDLRPQHLQGKLATLEFPELLRIGVEARDVLGRTASRCQVRYWLLELVRDLLPRISIRVDPLVDPWYPKPPFPPEPEPGPDPAPWLHAEMLLDSILGSSIYALGDAFPEPDPDIVAKVEEMDWTELLRPAAEIALAQTQEALERSGREALGLAESLGEGYGSQAGTAT